MHLRDSSAWVYIVSNRSHRIYVGITTDVMRRAREHREKKYPNGFTARYRFDRLVWFEWHRTIRAAAAREKEIKAWRRSKRVALIQQENPNWVDLSREIHELLRLD